MIRRNLSKVVDNYVPVCYYVFADTSSVVCKEWYMMQGSLPIRLRVLRVERGLTLREAADLAKVRPGTLSELERGLRHPHDVTLSRIAKAYDVPVEDLVQTGLAKESVEEPSLSPKAAAPPSAGSADEVDEERRDQGTTEGVGAEVTIRWVHTVAREVTDLVLERAERGEEASTIQPAVVRLLVEKIPA